MNLIKKCPDSGCDAIYHNCKESDKKCKDCGGSIKMINKDTFMKKYANWFFQYDYQTGEYFRPNFDKYLQQTLF
jgi:hypothetical protein